MIPACGIGMAFSLDVGDALIHQSIGDVVFDRHIPVMEHVVDIVLNLVL